MVFSTLGKPALSQIEDLLLDRSRRRVRAQGMELEVTQAAKDRLTELGYQPEFGARPLRRTLLTELDNRLATLLLDGTVEPGDVIRADVGEDGDLRVSVGSAASADSSADAKATA